MDSAKNTTEANYLKFLSGGKEMGELIRSLDWSKTAIGSPDTWPQSLRIAVGIMLDSPFGMYIAWGSEFIQLYNDGYRPILGATKHPQALGISTRKTFAEIWPTIGPMFEGVMQGTSIGFPDFILQLDRNGYLEECVFDFSYSPIRLEDGEVGGVLVTVIETTEKVNSFKKISESNDQLNFAIEAAELGTWDFNPITKKFTCNHRLKEWFGLQDEIENDLSKALEAISVKDRERVSKGIQNALLYELGGHFDVEYSIINPSSHKEIIVRGKGKAWFGNNKIAYRFNGTLQDITEQAIARRKIEESEANLRNLILQAPVAMSVISGPNFIIDLVNRKQLELWRKEEVEVLKKPLLDVFPEIKAQTYEKLLTEVYNTGIQFNGKEINTLLNRNGTLENAYFDFAYEPKRNEKGEVEGIIVTSYEVTETVNARKIIEKNEKRLQRERMSLHNFFTQAPAVLAILKGPDHVFEFANPAYLELVGNRDIIDKPLLDALPEIADQGFVDLLDNVYKTGEPFIGKEISVMLDKGNGLLESTFMNFTYQSFDNEKGETEGIFVFAYDVTEQINARKKIEESEFAIRQMASYLKLATDSANVGTWSFNIRKEELVWSALHKKMWGYDEHRLNLIFEDWHTLILQEDKQNIFKKLDESRVNYTVYDVNYSITRANDGAQRYIHSVGKFHYNEKGEAETLTGISIDITEQKEAEIKLKASELKYRGLFETMEQGFCIIKMIFDNENQPVDYLFLEANPMFEKHSGTSNPVGKTMRELVPNLSDRWFQIYGKVASTGIANHFVEQSKELNRWFEVYAFRLEDDKDNKVAVLFTDITKRKLAEEKVQENETQFRLFADSIQNLAWIANADGWINWYNQQWYEYTGTTFAEMEGFGWQKVHHPDHVKNIVEISIDLWQKGEPFELTFPLRRHDGEYRWFLTRAYPVKDVNGIVERWIGTNTDITEQRNFAEELGKKVKERTEELQTKNVELENINAELASFSYVASHDLKEPLRKIQVFSKRILETDRFQEKTQDYFMRIISASERMQSLINSLLDFSRTNTSDLIFEACDLNIILEEVKINLHEIIEEKQARIDSDTLPILDGIMVQLTQLMTNLLDNSLKYNTNGVKPHIVITYSLIEGELIDHPFANSTLNYHIIKVADNGIGFEKEYSSKIFQLFQRLHGKNEYSGTGIGLAICKKILSNHNGFIIADSVLGQGATFTMYIPKSDKKS
ncbi:hypothetical protein BH11BAC2_BH11BAC2_14230 [soil metagenome]